MRRAAARVWRLHASETTPRGSCWQPSRSQPRGPDLQTSQARLPASKAATDAAAGARMLCCNSSRKESIAATPSRAQSCDDHSCGLARAAGGSAAHRRRMSCAARAALSASSRMFGMNERISWPLCSVSGAHGSNTSAVCMPVSTGFVRNASAAARSACASAGGTSPSEASGGATGAPASAAKAPCACACACRRARAAVACAGGPVLGGRRIQTWLA